MGARSSLVSVSVAVAVLSFAPIAAQAGDDGPRPPAAAAAEDPAEAARMQRARFSGKRFLLSSLAGAVVGSLVAYGTFSALCDDDSDCFGAALASVGANFAITPLSVWGAGNALGGDGHLAWTYLGGTAAFAGLSVPGSPDESYASSMMRFKIAIAIGVIALPFTSSLLYEVSSNTSFVRWRERNHVRALGLSPMPGRSGVDGIYASISFGF